MTIAARKNGVMFIALAIAEIANKSRYTTAWGAEYYVPCRFSFCQHIINNYIVNHSKCKQCRINYAKR